MKHFALFITAVVCIGWLSSCGNDSKQAIPEEQARYHIHYSDTSTIKKAHKNVLIISAPHTSSRNKPGNKRKGGWKKRSFNNRRPQKKGGGK